MPAITFRRTAGLLIGLSLFLVRPVAAGEEKPRRPSEDPRWDSYPEAEKNRRRMDWAEFKMKAQLGSDFRIIRHPPFLIGANCGEERVKKIQDQILEKFSKAVMKQFDMKNVRHEIRVYLFKKDSDDYQTYALKMWKTPAPPEAGAYALPTERALMVPDQGGGLGLIYVQHEIIHILWRYDVKEPARWFDEGFAAYFEHAKVQPAGDRVKVGFHMRLHEAQAYAKSEKFSLAEMMKGKGMDDYMVYPVGSHLFIYLQEKGLLEKYYRAYRDGHAGDPTGRQALEKVTGRKIADFEKDWKAWVLARKNPVGESEAARGEKLPGQPGTLPEKNPEGEGGGDGATTPDEEREGGVPEPRPAPVKENPSTEKPPSPAENKGDARRPP